MLPCQSFTCKLNMQFTCDNANLAINGTQALTALKKSEQKERPVLCLISSLVSSSPLGSGQLSVMGLVFILEEGEEVFLPSPRHYPYLLSCPTVLPCHLTLTESILPHLNSYLHLVPVPWIPIVVAHCWERVANK